MRKHKSSLSQEESCKGIGEFWNTHDLADFLDRTREANIIDVKIKSETIYYAEVKKILITNQEANRGNSSKN